MTSDRLERLKNRLEPAKELLLNHPIYAKIDRLSALQVLMQCHVFAVWDFMSLLKALQRKMCCCDVPWLPVPPGVGARLVNEIVLAEESDEDGRGSFASHFDLYLRAMQACGADTTAIEALLHDLRQGVAWNVALQQAAIPQCAREFVAETFRVIAAEDLVSLAATFTFGREDLLPGVFQRIVDELNIEAAGGLDDFKYYLVRHIGLDGDEHGPLANQLLTMLCGEDEAKWQVAEEAAARCLEARLRLWNGIDALIAASPSLAQSGS